MCVGKTSIQDFDSFIPARLHVCKDQGITVQVWLTPRRCDNAKKKLKRLNICEINGLSQDAI